MPRPKNTYDKEEVEEIINLKLKDLKGIKHKLTYNNVWTFNKELVSNKNKRSNGEEFHLYGYTFWASSYDGEDYYGKQRIDEIKKDTFILAGSEFETELQDILILMEDYEKNPRKTSEIIIKIFSKNESKIKFLKEKNKRLEEKYSQIKKELEQFKDVFYTMFFSSIESSNSLKDVMSLKKKNDNFIYEKLKDMFDDEFSFIENKLNENEFRNNRDLKVFNLEDRIKELEQEGF